MLGQQPRQPGYIPGVDRLDHRNGQRILGIEDHHVGTAAHTAHPNPARVDRQMTQRPLAEPARPTT